MARLDSLRKVLSLVPIQNSSSESYRASAEFCLPLAIATSQSWLVFVRRGALSICLYSPDRFSRLNRAGYFFTITTNA